MWFSFKLVSLRFKPVVLKPRPDVSSITRLSHRHDAERAVEQTQVYSCFCVVFVFISQLRSPTVFEILLDVCPCCAACMWASCLPPFPPNVASTAFGADERDDGGDVQGMYPCQRNNPIEVQKNKKKKRGKKCGIAKKSPE
jgi:hypothetical protein